MLDVKIGPWATPKNSAPWGMGEANPEQFKWDSMPQPGGWRKTMGCLCRRKKNTYDGEDIWWSSVWNDPDYEKSIPGPIWTF